MSKEEVVRRETMPAGVVEMDAEQYDRMKGIATMFAQAGIFKDVDGAPVAFAKMVIGRELGLGIPQSMTGIHLIPGGGVQMHYSTILQCVRENGYDYRIVENSAEQCVIKWFLGPASDGNEIGETKFTMEMAKRAEFGKRSGMYEKVPENMLLARAVSNGAKAHVPAAFKGMPVYVMGEITQGEITAGEGTGEARGIELPDDVVVLIDRAEGLGHQGWAERSAWEYRVDRGQEFVDAAVVEATAELDELEKISDAQVEPDVPIDTEGLPTVLPEGATFAEVARASEEAAEGETKATEVPGPEETLPIVEHEPEHEPKVPSDVEPPKPAKAEEEIDVEALRRRLAVVEKMKPETEADKEIHAAEIEWIEEQLAVAAGREAGASDKQGRLV